MSEKDSLRFITESLEQLAADRRLNTKGAADGAQRDTAPRQQPRARQLP
jgi:hypothetical protein